MVDDHLARDGSCHLWDLFGPLDEHPAIINAKNSKERPEGLHQLIHTMFPCLKGTFAGDFANTILIFLEFSLVVFRSSRNIYAYASCAEAGGFQISILEAVCALPIAGS